MTVNSWNKYALADSALLLLIAASKDYRTSMELSTQKPRISSVLLGTLDPVQIKRQATLLRYISTTEAYIDAVNGSLLWEELGTPTNLLRAMVQEIEQSASSNWPNRQRAFKNLHGVTLSSQTSWKNVEAATHARNSIAHGLGRLTASQRRNKSLPGILLKIDVRVSGGRLAITDASLQKVFRACSDFIRSVDQAI